MHLARYEKICRENCRLQPDQVILVGLSGGADSLCLADLLDRLGYPLAVAYFNHGLRPEAAHEAETIAQLATSRGWQYLSTSAPIAEMARQQILVGTGQRPVIQNREAPPPQPGMKGFGRHQIGQHHPRPDHREQDHPVVGGAHRRTGQHGAGIAVELQLAQLAQRTVGQVDHGRQA